jgi:hypothetical protein
MILWLAILIPIGEQASAQGQWRGELFSSLNRPPQWTRPQTSKSADDLIDVCPLVRGLRDPAAPYHSACSARAGSTLTAASLEQAVIDLRAVDGRDGGVSVRVGRQEHPLRVGKHRAGIAKEGHPVRWSERSKATCASRVCDCSSAARAEAADSALSMRYIAVLAPQVARNRPQHYRGSSWSSSTVRITGLAGGSESSIGSTAVKRCGRVRAAGVRLVRFRFVPWFVSAWTFFIFIHLCRFVHVFLVFRSEVDAE